MRLGPTLTVPHGRVHWAGTETSIEFFGLMEGAIRSGRRAARARASTLLAEGNLNNAQGVVVGNTNASAGYPSLAAWLIVERT